MSKNTSPVVLTAVFIPVNIGSPHSFHAPAIVLTKPIHTFDIDSMAGLTPSLHKEFQDALNVSNIVPFKDNVWDAKSVSIGNPTETKFASIGCIIACSVAWFSVTFSSVPFPLRTNSLPLITIFKTYMYATCLRTAGPLALVFI